MFICWIGLEIKMFGVIPFLTSKKSEKSTFFDRNKEINVRFFYFFVQVIGRLFFGWGAILGGWYAIRIIGLMIKIGIAPFFWWVPSVIPRLNWLSIGLLRTLQKAPGLFLFRLMFDISLDICVLFSLLGFLIARIGIKFSYKNIKKLVAWSSIRNMRILFLLIVLKGKLGSTYYLFYRILVLSLCFSLQSREINLISSRFVGGKNIKKIIRLKRLLLVFTGLPPFISFLLKVYFLRGYFLQDRCQMLMEIDLKGNEVGFFYLLGSYLKGWNVILIYIVLIVIQSIGYVKAFININTRSRSSPLNSTRIKSKDKLILTVFSIVYLIRVIIIWL